MAGITYVRLCPQLASDIRLDETSDEVICTCNTCVFPLLLEVIIRLSDEAMMSISMSS